ncbi:VOC family protein [Nocardia callitridis]|uniref:PhnB-like domain-containing protein n=1 Tax=Nocardia callitridis TaxID=648753 RepID=A0ABP9KQN0_9NOCA
MQTSTFLYFNDGRAEEAADYYVGIFPDAKILDRQRGIEGKVTTVTFELAGQRYITYNGELEFPLTPAISLYVDCETQQEVDTLWSALTLGGQEGPGGSLTDRFGVTWQIYPKALRQLLDDTEPAAAERILNAMHGMKKIELQGLIDARDR